MSTLSRRQGAALAAVLALAAVKSYTRTENGRVERVSGYVKRGVRQAPERTGHWIPEKDWLKGQQEWVAKGEAAWKAAHGAASSPAKRATDRIKEQAAGGTGAAKAVPEAAEVPARKLEIPPDGPPKITPYAEVGEEDPTGWANDLPDFDQLAVNDYVSNEGSQVINGALRAGHLPKNGTADPPLTFQDYEMAAMFGEDVPAGSWRRGDEVHSLDKLERKYTTTAPVSLYRGMALSPELEAKLKPGAIFTDKGFTSTSTDAHMAEQFAQLRTTGHFTDPELNAMGAKALGGKAVLMHIIVPKGFHIMPGEADNIIYEYVLPRGGRYRVEKILPPGNYPVPEYILTALPPGKAS